MSFLQRLMCAALMGALTFLEGCTALPTMAQASLAASPSQGQERRQSLWVDGAKDSVWARVQRLDAQGQFTRSLIRACDRGVSVEVIAHVGDSRQAAALKHTCLRIWLTNHPEVRRFPDTLLIDSTQLVIEGNLDNIDGARARNEYRAQARVKKFEAVMP